MPPKIVFATLILVSLVVVPYGLTVDSLSAGQKKMSAEELVEKHLASIGTAPAREAARTRAMNGTVQVDFLLGGKGRLAGDATLLSDTKKVRFGISFPHPEYPGEQLAFDGRKVTTGFLHPGLRSNLSKFVYEYGFLLSEGLLGGSLTTSWCLLDVAGRKAKLRYSGIKNVDGRDLHELRYTPRRNPGGFQILLYFEPDTFRHAVSIYQLRVPAYMAHKTEDSPRQVDDYYTIREEFGDYRSVDGTVLPHAYKLAFTARGRQAFLAEWNVRFSSVTHNVTLDAGYFSMPNR